MKIIPLASGSSGNAYIIADNKGENPLLLEAGLAPNKLKKKLWDNNISIYDIDYCLISHKHLDHFQSAEYLTNYSTNIIYPKTNDSTFKTGLKRKDRVIYLEHNKLIEAGKYKVLGLKLEHDGVPILGYFIKYKPTGEKIFYATDTMYIKYKPKDINYWMIEVNYQRKFLEEAIKEGRMTRYNMRRIMRSHMGLDTAVEFFKANDLSKTKEIYTIHSSKRNSNPGEIKNTMQKETGLPVYVW